MKDKAWSKHREQFQLRIKEEIRKLEKRIRKEKGEKKKKMKRE